jgi:hypothetical protein
MHTYVYKSRRKPDTYLYLREKDAFSLLPEAILLPLGRLELALEFELDENRRLARADAGVVLRNLRERGFHLQMPETMLDPLVAGGVGDG